MLMKIRIISLGLILGAGTSWGFLGSGIVHDPINWVQNVLTEVNTSVTSAAAVSDLILFEKQMAEVVGEFNEIMAFANSLKGYLRFSYLLDSDLLAELRRFQREAEELQDWSEFQPGVKFSVSQRVAGVQIPTWDEMAEKEVKIQQAFTETMEALQNAKDIKRNERQEAMDSEPDKEREYQAKLIASTQGVLEEIENLDELMTKWAAFDVQKEKAQTEQDAMTAVAEDAAVNAAVEALAKGIEIPEDEKGLPYYERALRPL